MDKAGKLRYSGKRIWHFFWKDDSIWSWIANILVAFLVIRYVFYPVLGVLLGTSYPIVAVISESMEHRVHTGVLCGEQFDQLPESFNSYWRVCGQWYEQQDISPEGFSRYPFPQGFNKGDVIILWRAHRENLQRGDILIFQGNRPQPIIHRIVGIKDIPGEGRTYQTKGDHNSDSIEGAFGETEIGEERILGKGIIRIPYLGWLKIIFVDAVRPLGIEIER